jgi:hypothetical protein
MRLPVPPREQRGGEDASPPQPCKSESQKNTGAQRMVYFPIEAIDRPFGFNAGSFPSDKGIYSNYLSR